MNQLLAEILDAHGGINRWNEYHKIQATMVSGGSSFQLKGITLDSAPRRMSVWLYEARSSVLPYGAPDQRTMFTPDRLTIEKLDGTVIALPIPAHRRNFAAHIFQPLTPEFWIVWVRKNKKSMLLPSWRQCIKSSFQGRDSSNST